MNDGSLSSDGVGAIMVALLLLCAVLYFGIIANGPPASAHVGPFTIGTDEGVCHGIQQNDQPVLAFCK